MWISKILQNKLLRFLISGAIFCTVWIIFKDNLSEKIARKRQCEGRDEVSALDIEGVIISKYRDRRNLRHFLYRKGIDTVDCEIFIVEGSDFYSFLKEGDSVKKERGSLLFNVKRNGQDTTHILNYGCE